MTRDELLQALADLQGGHPDKLHARADELLLEYLDDPDIARAHHRAPKPLSYNRRKLGSPKGGDVKAIAYARYSPRPNENDVYSAERQLEAIRHYCKRNGIILADEFRDEGRSGDDEDRPGLWKAIDKLQKGMLLLVYSYNRLARSDRFAALVTDLIDKRGATCFSISENRELSVTPEAEFQRRIQFAIGELQLSQIRERTRMGMRRHQANGRPMSGIVAYGQRETEPVEVMLPDGSIRIQRKTEPDPQKVAIIREICQLFAGGMGLRGIAKLLTRRGDPAPLGEAWNHNTVHAILVREGLLEPRQPRRRRPSERVKR